MFGQEKYLIYLRHSALGVLGRDLGVNFLPASLSSSEGEANKGWNGKVEMELALHFSCSWFSPEACEIQHNSSPQRAPAFQNQPVQSK
jgi:hypothetical protein